MNKKLLLSTFLMLILCTILVLLSYFYIDKPVAEFFYLNRSLGKSETWLGYLIRYSTLIEYLPPFLALFFICKNNIVKALGKNENKFMLIAFSATLTTSIKDILKFVFGRYWPATWINNNPSWLESEKYGFNFFHSGVSYSSFPSGHAAAIFAIMTAVWLVYPKWRWLCVLSTSVVSLSLVILDYHFVSDVIAGMFLGIIVGQNTVYCFSKLENTK